MKRCSLFLACLLPIFALAQHGERHDFRPPLNIPLNLSGNFGELRSNHFHTGLDLKTQGREGLPVFAVTGGCVSRIRVGAYGYGNTLCIDHPNGFTTVYAHLQHFNDSIEAYVKKAQYDLQSWEVDLYPGGCALPIDSSEIIAASGNSGSSGGPHLHFEIRETESEFPVNPLLWDFPVADHRAPLVKGILIEPRDEGAYVFGSRSPQLFETIQTGSIVRLQKSQTIEVHGPVGIGVHTIDLLDGNANNCGIHRIVLTMDGDTLFEQSIDRLDFAENRAMNAHANYGLLKQERKHIHRTFRLPNNRLPIYKTLKNNGEVLLRDGEIHEMRLEVSDVHGNLSAVQFEMKGVAAPMNESKSLLPTGASRFYFDKVNRLTRDSALIYMTEGSLYEDCWAWIQPASNRLNSESAAKSGLLAFSRHYEIGNRYEPLHKEAFIALAVRDLPIDLQSKVLVAHYGPDRKRYSARGGTYHQGWVSTKVKQFGTYVLLIDTIAPRIRLGEFSDRSLSFTISDDLSGIDRIEAFVDGKWLRFHYDPKRNRIWHNRDDGVMPKAWKEFVLEVSDERGNTSRFTRLNSQ